MVSNKIFKEIRWCFYYILGSSLDFFIEKLCLLFGILIFGCSFVSMGGGRCRSRTSKRLFFLALHDIYDS